MAWLSKKHFEDLWDETDFRLKSMLKIGLGLGNRSTAPPALYIYKYIFFVCRCFFLMGTMEKREEERKEKGKKHLFFEAVFLFLFFVGVFFYYSF